MKRIAAAGLIGMVLLSFTRIATGDSPTGYYRQPAIHGDTIVFVAEGDLWKVSAEGGVASRLTSHQGRESGPAISPDGRTLAFTAEYEGPTEVYTMPLAGGLPARRTFDAARCSVAGFTPDGRLLCATRHFATLPDSQLTTLDLATGARNRIPLSQAAQGVFDEAGRTLFFTRFARQSSHTKRYKGGTAENIWKFDVAGEAEAVPLTTDYAGTSTFPMFWKGRVYFASDRDGTMNIWSVAADGSGAKQHTRHKGWDVKSPSLSSGRIVYQLGADLHVYDITIDRGRKLAVTLETDFDHTREKWIDKPMDYVTAAHISPDGKRVVLTARGEVFVAPHRQGRLVRATRRPDVRYRSARFLPGGESLVVLSDESGEVELWTLPANGVGERNQLTEDGKVLRWTALPSPDGKWLAQHDKDQQLWVYNVADDSQRLIDESPNEEFADLSWSADSRWLAYRAIEANQNGVIRLYNVETKKVTRVTTDRYHSFSPAWSADGKWLYFLSERHFRSLVGSPWGRNQPEPFFDRTRKIHALALQPGLRSPFAPDTELTRAEEEEEDESDEKERKEEKNGDEKDEEPEVEPIEIDLAGIAERIHEVPVKPGNYSGLFVTKKRLFWTAVDDLHERKRDLMILKIANKDIKTKTLVEDVRSVELSADGKKLLVRKGSKLHITNADASAPAKLEGKNEVNLEGWRFSFTPREQWRQMFIEAWRLERDYFYDRDMHGVDWPATRDKFLPLVDRVSDRAELSDLIAQMVSELSALHIYVYGGDRRRGQDSIQPASLGALLTPEKAAGGHRIEHIYQSDPDEPGLRSPLARLDLSINEGDVITLINGVPTADAADCGELLRNQAGKQVLLRIKPADGGDERDVVVEPISAGAASNLRYHEWEYTRRLLVDKLSGGQIGYVHLRAMGSNDVAQFARHFYPVFNRKGLIMDVRHNGGGNIDSWILEKLMRKAWFYWQPRVGSPTWNMQYAFRGHMVALCDERTGSDGEAFAEGFRRLGLGKVIGTRTWGGEIWLTSSNRLVDRGIATAAEFGVYGPEGQWLIEGHGVDPDLVVDNLPHATFTGDDAQLKTAVEHLLQKIKEEPVDVPPAPPHPDKSFTDNKPGTGP